MKISSDSPGIGVSFRNLSVYGVGDLCDYQSTFGNFIHRAISRCRKLFSQRKSKTRILKDFNGLVCKGEMLLVLGRPGSGCSTLLKTLAADTHGLSINDASVLKYQGIDGKIMHSKYDAECLYLAEEDAHFPELTVERTLNFVEGLQRCENRGTPLQLFNLAGSRNTKIGNDTIRGVSGGERKRVSIAEAYMNDSIVQCWDNSTRGLDSFTALNLVQNLREKAASKGTTIIVSLYQASQEIYDLFDKVTVLQSGRQVYFGPAKAAREYFSALGYKCPDRMSTADYLTALSHRPEAVNLTHHENGNVDIFPGTVEEFDTAWKLSVEKYELMQQISSFERDCTPKMDTSAQLHQLLASKTGYNTTHYSRYHVPCLRQIAQCMSRNMDRLRSEYIPVLSGILGNGAMGIIVGSLFFDLSDNTDSFYARSILIFFVTTMNAFTSAFEVLTMWAQRPIVEKHARYALYRPSAEAIASMVCDLPNKFLTSLVFNVSIYFMTKLRQDVSGFFIFWLFGFTTLVTMSMLFRAVGSLSRTYSQSMTPVGTLIFGFIIYTGFPVPVKYQRPWLSWFRFLNPVSYAYEAIMVNEFHGRRFSCPTLIPAGPTYDNISTQYKACSLPGAFSGSDSITGDEYLLATYDFQNVHLWRNLGILLAFMIVFCAIHLLAAERISAQKSKGEVLLYPRKYVQTREAVISDAAISPFVEQSGTMEAKTHLNEPLLPISTYHWSSLTYDIKTGGNERRLLNNINGWVRPGTLTALMGVTGAGKTTLLNVLAGRVSSGTLAGDIQVNNHPRPLNFQRKVGYVQQFDTHDPTTTVREAVRFSSILRQSASIPMSKRIEYSDHVLHMLEMQDFSNAIVGVQGEGLNSEQRRRLTIAVEMAAKPELLLFLDEPTSGLDSQTAWTICALLRKLANNGQAILCTMHQPSAQLFEHFDSILLLDHQGNELYFGDIGPSSRTLIDYFENNGAPPCKPKENPASWLFKVTGNDPGTQNPKDWASIWATSPEKAAVRNQLLQFKSEAGRDGHDELHNLIDDSNRSEDEYCASIIRQISTVTKRQFRQYWRLPDYSWGITSLGIGFALINGLSYYKSSKSIAGLQNQLFAVFFILNSFPNFSQLLVPRFISDRNIFEAREGPSKTYSWYTFLCSNMIVEACWISIVAVLTFVIWYYTIGFADSIPDAEKAERGVLMFLMIWEYFLFSSTFSYMMIAGVEHAQTAVNIAQLFFYLCIMFSGVLVRRSEIPRFWTFMYYVSPITYLVKGMFSAGVAHKRIACLAEEFVSLVPPAGQTCGQYLDLYMQAAGGQIADRYDAQLCKFCPLGSSDEYLSSLSIDYDTRWQDFGIVAGFIVVNVVGTFALYWLVRVPKPYR